MCRKPAAWIVLVALAAALVPGGMAPVAQLSAPSCCRGGRCPMMPASHNMSGHGATRHCEGAAEAESHQTLPGGGTCTCSLSQGPGTAVPATAFRFTFDLTPEPTLMQPAVRLQPLFDIFGSPLQGYHLTPDQPPKA